MAVFCWFPIRSEKKWRKLGPFLRRESVNCLKYDRKSKTLFAATHTNGVFVSRDFAKLGSREMMGST